MTTNELRPPRYYKDYLEYLPPGSDYGPEMLRRFREIDVNDVISLYHGFPEVQIEMIREEAEPHETEQP